VKFWLPPLPALIIDALHHAADSANFDEKQLTNIN
jgi:hypothetical protein